MPGAQYIFTYNWTYSPPGDNITICADYQNTVTVLNETVKPAVNAVEGILPPIELGRWERQSIPLRVSEQYKTLFGAFSSYFGDEMDAIGDDTLTQELDILDTLTGYE